MGAMNKMEKNMLSKKKRVYWKECRRCRTKNRKGIRWSERVWDKIWGWAKKKNMKKKEEKRICGWVKKVEESEGV